MTLCDLETPAGIVDLGRARDNIERAALYCRRHGIAWRPHVKTHKSVEMARLQIAAGASGLTVATPHEAEVMARVADDLLFAHPPAHPAKIRRLAALPEGVTVRVALDSLAVLRELCRAGAAAGRTFGILVEFDAGARRTGVAEPADVVRLAEAAATLPGGRFDGLAFYPGIRVARAEVAPALARVSRRLHAFHSALARVGLPPRIVSGGSTPTMWDSHRIAGLTEIRPGTCIYNDRDIAAMGAATTEHLAYSVLATVVSTAVPGQAVVDAGSKALSREILGSGGRGSSARGSNDSGPSPCPPDRSGFGVLLERPDVVVRAVNEEHGMLDLTGAAWRPAVGETVRIVPNHVCVSVNLQDLLWGFERPGGPLRPIALEARGRAPATETAIRRRAKRP